MTTSGGLFHRVIRGGVWVFTFSISQEIIALVRLVILARLLSPNDFGLAGIALLVLSTLDTFTQTSFDVALIQKKEDTHTYLDSAWTFGILRGIVVFAAVVLVAPYAAAFFKTPEATALVRVIGISILARSFTSIGVVYFRKDLEFNKQFLWQFSGRLADFAVAVAAAFLVRNAWALVLAFVAGDVIKLALSYLLHPYRPHLKLDRARIAELLGFGKWMLGLGILAFLLTQIDNALVGKLVGVTMLGFYQLARRISNVPATEIAHVISAVTLPAYSKLQDAVSKLREAYLMALQVTALVALPIAGIILALAAEITSMFFGDKWLPAVGAMRILAVWGALGALESTAEPVLLAVGKPRALSKYQAVQLVILAALIYPFTRPWGIAGTALAVTLAAGVPYFLVLRRVVKITGCRASDLLRLVLPPLGAASAAAAAVMLLNRWHETQVTSPLRLGLAMALYVAIYAALVRSVGTRVGYNIGPLAKQVLHTLKRRNNGSPDGTTEEPTAGTETSG